MRLLEQLDTESSFLPSERKFHIPSLTNDGITTFTKKVHASSYMLETHGEQDPMEHLQRNDETKYAYDKMESVWK
jgi:hypothetical protein